MTDALNFVFQQIAKTTIYLESWQFLGVPFLYWLIGMIILEITMRYIFD